MPTPIVIAFTPNYLIPAAVTLKSILDSSTAEFEVLCLVSKDIPDEQKEKLQKMTGDRIKYRYIRLAGKLDGYYIDPRYSEAASYRLLLPELLPETDKIIYIDCDVVVRQDLGQLYDSLEMGDNLLAAVYEAPIEGQAERWKKLGCDSNKYFNSGFLVMNLAQMRKERTSEKLLDVLKTDYLEFPDQDALNIVCQGRVIPLPPVFNSIRTFFLPQYKQSFLKQYSAKEWADIQNNGTIHYTGGKPWNVYSVKFDVWWKNYDALPKDIKAEWGKNSMMYVWALSKNVVVGSILRFLVNIKRLIKSHI